MSLWNKTLSTGKEINRFFQMEYWIKLFNLTIVQNNSSISYLFQKDSNRSRSDVEDEESSSSEYLPEQIQRGRGRGKRLRQGHTTVCIFFSLLIVTTDFFFIKVEYFWRIILLQKIIMITGTQAWTWWCQEREAWWARQTAVSHQSQTGKTNTYRGY